MASSVLSKNISVNRAILNEISTTPVKNNLVLTYNYPNDTIIDSANKYETYVDYNSHFNTRNINNELDEFITIWEERKNKNNVISGPFKIIDKKNSLNFISADILYIDSRQNYENDKIIPSIRSFSIISSSGIFKGLKNVIVNFNDDNRTITFS